MAGEHGRTWDGLARALDDPHGCSVVVRRHHGDGEVEFLLLHRAHHGADFEGDWAWTSPAGCRFPGEPVYTAALRELAEEAGITGYDVWAVDVTAPTAGGYQWAVFCLDLPADEAAGLVSLVDPEHDRFAWLPAAEAARRVRPSHVADSQVGRLAGVPRVATAYRPMVAADLAQVAAWWREPHARPWFHGDRVTDAEVERRLLPRLRGEVPTAMWVYEVDGRPAGYAQTYRVADHPDYSVKTGLPDAVAFDYLLGDAGLIGRGLGTRMVWELCRDVLRPEHPAAEHIIASPSHRNAGSLRVLAKCGFTQGLWIDEPGGPHAPPDTEIVCTLDVRRHFG